MTVFLRSHDFSPEQSWQLLSWCVSHGGTEFFVRMMGIVGEPEVRTDRARELLAPFRLPAQVRPRAIVYLGDKDEQETALWSLNSGSIAVLRGLLPKGLFTQPTYHNEGWIEEPTVYRNGAILLGVVSHEYEAFMDVTPAERADLAAHGFTLHDAGEWI